MNIHALRGLLAIALLSGTCAFAQAPATAPTPDAAAERVQADKTATYRAVLAEYDAAIVASPDVPAIAVARCEFISKFTDDEYGDWVETAPEELERCSEQLEKRWPKAPEARLFALEQVWGEDALELGKPLLAQADAWPAPLRRRLFSKMAEAYEDDDAGDPKRAGELAVAAALLGEGNDVASAVEHLAGQREFARAARLLREAAPAKAKWQADARVREALALPDARAAVAEMRRYARADFEINPALAAKAHLAAGDIAGARKVMHGATGTSDSMQEARFDTAVAAGDMRGAAAVISLADMEDLGENLQRFAIVLNHAPGMLFTGPMLLGAFALLVSLVLLALLPGLVLVPIHYRGLLRRVQGRAPVPLFEPFGLRHAWQGAAIMLCVPFAMATIVEPRAVAALVGGETVPPPDALFRITLWGTIAALLCLLPMARKLDLRELVGDRASWRAWWKIPLAWACLLGIGMVLAAMHGSTGGAPTTQTKMIDAMANSELTTFGPIATLLVMALLVPFFEELLFRGFILGGMSRHIGFAWANLAQATLFALIHDDLPRFPYYLALGLFGGWLVKSSRSLGPAIALHALNNAVAMSLRVFG